MECKQCGGPMMLETVIKLQRSFIGFRVTRFAGAYCVTCQIGIPVESDLPSRRQDDDCVTCQIGIPVESDLPSRRQDDVRALLGQRVRDRLTGLLCRSRPMYDSQPLPHRAAPRCDGAAVTQDREASGFI